MATMNEIAKWTIENDKYEHMIEKSGQQQGAKGQFAFVEALERATITLGRNPRDNSTAYVGIMRGQREKIARFGDKAFPMTERQVAEVARTLRNF